MTVSKELKRNIAAILGTRTCFITVARIEDDEDGVSFVSITCRGFRYCIEAKDNKVVKTFCGWRE